MQDTRLQLHRPLLADDNNRGLPPTCTSRKVVCRPETKTGDYGELQGYESRGWLTAAGEQHRGMSIC